ncbi:MAG: lipoate--protein ligase [Bacteroidales bacterium]|nr:lipoate--protein ligase [Bacteroidales bacterium]
MLQFVVSSQTNPYWNIAVENFLVEHAEAVTLYLWRNRRTVVIGQNQNPYSEVNLDALEADDGYLMRRKTGGGAVYHDDGNLNFSFVVPKPIYDQGRQFRVIQRAVESFGLHTELSGRNDILCEGRKFSGNAFSKGRFNDLHHGTILIKGNMEDLARYLKPKPAKLQKHGVQSVRSRVVNLADLNPAISAEALVPRLRKAFEDEYAGTADEISFDSLRSNPRVCELFEEFSSPEWKYSNWRTFSAHRSGQFDWGGVELQLSVEDGVISNVQIASDALDLAALDEARRLLTDASNANVPQSDNPIINDIIKLAFGQ